MTRTVATIMRIVVASPGDVQNERDSIKRVAEELNQGVARDRGLRLEVARWEEEAYPGVHLLGPQGLISAVLRIPESDIVIVIFGRRLGTPVLGTESGTAYELREALEAWKENGGRPQVMVYFKTDSGEPVPEAEKEQWERLKEFKDTLPYEIFSWHYVGDEFEDLVRGHLTRFLRDNYPIKAARNKAPPRRSDRNLLSRYLERIAKEPLVRTALFAGEYQVEPADLLWIILREVQFQYGDPVRAIRTKEPHLPLSQLEGKLTARDAGSIRNAVLLGEAGVGKTTTCRWLCRRIAEGAAAVPIYIPLGEWDPRQEDFEAWLDKRAEGRRFDRLAAAAHQARRRLVLFLDGWNEQEVENLKHVRAFARRRTGAQDTAVVVTSRPVAALDSLWPEGDAHFFEIDRWTPKQLASYFSRNGRDELLARVPPEIRNVLRLPLLAFLLIRRLGEDEQLPALRSVADVFDYVLERFLQAPQKAPQQDRVLGGAYPALAGDPRAYLQEFAYEMTRNKVVRTDAEALESVLSHGDRNQFRPFLAHLIHSGLLRCSNAVAAVDPDMTLHEIRALKIAFLHQAFQEYLTAQRFLAPSPPEFPTDVSHDAFWREVPVHLVQGYDSVSEQRAFANRFLETEPPDYLTSARLAHEITDPGERGAAEREVAVRLVEDLRRSDLYPYTIEAFGALGAVGVEALRRCLADEGLLARTFARYEAHLIDPRIAAEADEEGWRPLGRAIYILGELGDFWIAERLAGRLSSLRSLHLLYHVGEALLTLVRRREPGAGDLETIQTAGRRLARLERNDAVTRAQACAVEIACGDGKDERAMAARELGWFLRNQSAAGEHFLDEFWRRAHGVEAFAEVAEWRELVPVLEALFETEDTADYDSHEIIGYRPVQSSIVKAVRRCCDLRLSEPEAWHGFLERAFQSRRIDENGWACRHLEHLLLRWFGRRIDLDWIRSWQGSSVLGGERVRAVLSNVLWLAG